MLTFKTVNDTLATLQVTQRPLGISVLEDLTAFRNDVNANGHIEYSDIALIRQQQGTSLP